MKNLTIYTLLLVVLFSAVSRAQETGKFLSEKPGKWMYSSNIKLPGTEVAAFNKNLATLAEWFHLNVPMLKSPQGYDADAWVYDMYNDSYKLNSCNYAMRAEVKFHFQLFFGSGGKWTVEPPSYRFYVNNTEEGHGTNPHYEYFDAEYYNYRHADQQYKFTLADERAINEAVTKMNGVFTVFPFVKELAPGVNLYDCEMGGSGAVVVFNPDRPDFWIPVTLRELADMHLEYYSGIRDELLLPQLKKEIALLSEEELNAPAYEGHDTHFVLKANGKSGDLQFMRFNPEYWDRSLPPSAIQFMTFYYPQMDKRAMDEYLKDNGYPNYNQMLSNEIDWRKLAGECIVRKH